MGAGSSGVSVGAAISGGTIDCNGSSTSVGVLVIDDELQPRSETVSVDVRVRTKSASMKNVLLRPFRLV